MTLSKGIRNRRKEDPIIRFWRRIDQTFPDQCWEWPGWKGWNGYGFFEISPGFRMAAHRWAWQSRHGPVPVGLELDHLCRNRLCVNPAHLEPVTHAENVRRGHLGKARREQTHCKRGHSLIDPANVIWHPRGWRQCRECRKGIMARYKARRALMRQESA